MSIENLKIAFMGLMVTYVKRLNEVYTTLNIELLYKSKYWLRDLVSHVDTKVCQLNEKYFYLLSKQLRLFVERENNQFSSNQCDQTSRLFFKL